jgi:hypothetical protein
MEVFIFIIVISNQIKNEGFIKILSAIQSITHNI